MFKSNICTVEVYFQPPPDSSLASPLRLAVCRNEPIHQTPSRSFRPFVFCILAVKIHYCTHTMLLYTRDISGLILRCQS
ncbi:hypothetical protein E2C01_051737 [Portunus trituberculatus]|uniref:Uncharacterized protein n=1 Tax=Portunus trituberculatus TaxID=210409 RepID=A0A5B7GBU2_PORTR|nr:hypothetical protein [Portunus trituberculatus]